ncbi:MAG TPA: hypothetical protein VFG10_08880 [Saprospiraceae bacterium]|nr:hypothetical protein [Saprospiraceae bacterium]
MKRNLLFLISLFTGLSLNAQDKRAFHQPFQIKVEPLELGYDYSRIGIGIEKKFMAHSLWTSFHYGTNLDYSQARDSPSGHFEYYEVELGAKRILYSDYGEYFFGGNVGFDKGKRYVDDDVYYDIDGKFAVLLENAYNYRTRLSLFLENGYEFYIGKRFSIETSAGLGLRSVQNYYSYVTNPFRLNNIEPREYRKKSQQKYVGQWIKVAVTGGLKLGWRI